MKPRTISKVKKFFSDTDVVYARPDTDNHLANFYGDEFVCALTMDDVIDCIELAVNSWDMTEDDVVDVILGDLQKFEPGEI